MRLFIHPILNIFQQPGLLSCFSHQLAVNTILWSAVRLSHNHTFVTRWSEGTPGLKKKLLSLFWHTAKWVRPCMKCREALSSESIQRCSCEWRGRLRGRWEGSVGMWVKLYCSSTSLLKMTLASSPAWFDWLSLKLLAGLLTFRSQSQQTG